MENVQISDLRKENEELKRTLSICLNKPLVKELAEAMKIIDCGEYITEEEFFRNSL